MKRSDDVLVLVVEPRIRRFVRAEIERVGWAVLEAATGTEAVACARDSAPDCVLLDLVLPDFDGFEVVRQIREFSGVPILLLTGRNSEEDRVRGLDLGADDYIAKPFGVRELLARVRANLRRTATSAGQPKQVTIENLTVDFGMRRVISDGKPVPLTPTEFGLLAELAGHAGVVLLPADLLRAVWGPAYVDDVGLLRTAIWRLRQKLEPDPQHPRYIVTVNRVGLIQVSAQPDRTFVCVACFPRSA